MNCTVPDHFVHSFIAIEDSSDFTYIAFQESLYNVNIWRQYDLRTTVMSIVGPLVFFKWIQFARGNKVLGPFVRMIFKVSCCFRSVGFV